MIRTINPVVYFTEKRTNKELSGVVTEIVTSFDRLPLEKKYKLDVLFLVDGKAWKTETFYKSYQEVDYLKETIKTLFTFDPEVNGSDLEDLILEKGLLFVAVNDQHFGLQESDWRFLEEGEKLFDVDETISELPELPEVPEPNESNESENNPEK